MAKNTQEDLKPCPFCQRGLEMEDLWCSEVDGRRVNFRVECPRCLARGPQSEVMVIAVRNWNGAKRRKGYE